MKNSLILLLSVFVLSACGGKKTSNAVISINAGALISGSTPAGGVVLLGSNGVDKFSVGLTSAEASSYSLELPQGQWNFSAVAWLNDGALGNMTGKTRCGVAQSSVQGSDVSVELSLTNENCSSAFFGDVSLKDTTSYPGETTFKRLRLNSCNNPVGYPALCDNSGAIESIPGESVSFRLVLPGFSSFGAATPSLVSTCLNPDVLNQGLFSTDIRLPVGATSPLPVLLRGFEKLNCVDEDPLYALTDKAIGLPIVDHQITGNTGVDYTVTFADNYVGVTGSPFIHAHNNNMVKLPVMNCGGTCYNTINSSVDHSVAKDEVRQGIWSLFGSNDQKDSQHFSPASEASLTITNGVGGQVILSPFSMMGSKGNNLVLNLSSSGPSGNTASVDCNAGSGTIDISATDDVAPNIVAAEVNTNCSGFVMASTGANPTGGGLFPPVITNFSGGDDSFNNQGRRQKGSITEIAHILFGGIGAVLHANGITTGPQLCSATGSYSYQLPRENVTVSFGTPTGLALHPLFSTNTTSNFERKIVININGVNEEAFYFNCADSIGNEDYAVGTYIMYKNDNEVEYTQTSWDVTTANDEWFDRSVMQTRNGFTNWRYDLFKREGTGDSWFYWSMNASEEFSSYRRIAATTTGTPGSIFASANNASIDATQTFLGGGQKEWSLSSGNYLSNGGNVSSDPATINASMTNPRTYPSFSINDMVNNDAFWDFSY